MIKDVFAWSFTSFRMTTLMFLKDPFGIGPYRMTALVFLKDPFGIGPYRMTTLF
jgi:hypothetical protein